jgi:hypothetical protein
VLKPAATDLMTVLMLPDHFPLADSKLLLQVGTRSDQMSHPMDVVVHAHSPPLAHTFAPYALQHPSLLPTTCAPHSLSLLQVQCVCLCVVI